MVEKNYTAEEVCEILRIKPDTLSKFIRQGKIKPVIRVSRKIRLIPESTLDAYLKANTGEYK